jgi:hypothetical protein
MPFDHESHICRALYKNARKQGAPAVVMAKFGDEFFVETSDGKVGQMMQKWCCAAAMRYKIAALWLEGRPTSPTKGER